MKEEKKLGIFSGVAASVGLVLGSTCFVTIGQGAGAGGIWYCLALIPVMILALCAMTSCSELCDIFPKSKGNIPTIWGAIFGPVGEILNNWISYFSSVSIFSAMESVLAAQCFSMAFLGDACANKGLQAAIAIGITVALTIANIYGVDIFAKIQNVVFTIMMVTLVGLSLVGACGIAPTGAMQVHNVPEYTGASGILEIGKWALYIFIGLECLIPMKDDMKNPKRDIRVSLYIGAITLAITYGILGLGLNRYIASSVLAENDLPNMVYATTLFGHFGTYWMGLATVCAAISTSNTGIQSCPRFLAGSGSDGTMPKAFLKKNKHGAPAFSIAFMGIFQIALILLQMFTAIPMGTILLISCAFYEIGYVGDHVIVLILRVKYPKADRINKLKLFNIPQVAAIICLVYFVYTMMRDPIVLWGSIIAIGIVLAYGVIWSIGVMHQSPFKPVYNQDIEDLKALNSEEIEFPAGAQAII